MKRIARAVVGLALLSTLGACHHSGDGAAASPPAMELKVYSGQPGRMEYLASALNSSLAPLKGHAAVTGPGQLLVYAPRDEQPSIAAAIEQLDKVSSATSTAPLRVRFWMIEAQPGVGSNDPALAPLADALKAWQGNMGPQHFVLREAVAAVSASGTGRSGSIRTASMHQFDFQPHWQGDVVKLDIAYQASNTGVVHGINSLRVEVAMHPGKYLVLAQAPTQPASLPLPNGFPAANPTTNDTPAAGSTRLLIVRVDPLDATD